MTAFRRKRSFKQPEMRYREGRKTARSRRSCLSVPMPALCGTYRYRNSPCVVALMTLGRHLTVSAIRLWLVSHRGAEAEGMRAVGRSVDVRAKITSSTQPSGKAKSCRIVSLVMSLRLSRVNKGPPHPILASTWSASLPEAAALLAQNPADGAGP